MMIEQRSSAHHQETTTQNSLSETQSNNENNNPISSDFLSSPIKKRPMYNSATNGMVVASNAEATPTGATLQKHPNQTTTTAVMTNGDDARAVHFVEQGFKKVAGKETNGQNVVPQQVLVANGEAFIRAFEELNIANRCCGC